MRNIPRSNVSRAAKPRQVARANIGAAAPTPDARLDSKVKVWVAVLGLIGVLAGVAATVYVGTRPVQPKSETSSSAPALPTTITNTVTNTPQIHINNVVGGTAPAAAQSEALPAAPAVALPAPVSRADLHACLPNAFPYSQMPAHQMAAALRHPEVMHPALLDAAEKGKTSCVRGFIAAGISANSNESTVTGRVKGQTPLLAAIQNKQLTTVRALLEDGADPGLIGLAGTGKGTTPLMQAVGFLPEAVPLLLAKNVDVNYEGDSGDTALHSAAARGYVAIVKALLERGAKKDVKFHGSTPLDAARHFKHEEVAALLSAK